jgi:hypothetical protein
MSMQWHGGKGSKQRTTNYSAYSDNFDKIFRKKDMREELQWDVYGDEYECPKAVDLLEDDVISWSEVDDGIEIKIVHEAYSVGEAGARGGSVFTVPTAKFKSEYKPAFR